MIEFLFLLPLVLFGIFRLVMPATDVRRDSEPVIYDRAHLRCVCGGRDHQRDDYREANRQ